LPNRSFRHDPTTNPARAALNFSSPNVEDVRCALPATEQGRVAAVPDDACRDNRGQVYQGLVIYEAVDSLILQTGPATTDRFLGKQIASRRVSPLSLMPAGLLDNLSDQDIADLYAYLRSKGSPSGEVVGARK
jgi:hypothetical protein